MWAKSGTTLFDHNSLDEVERQFGFFYFIHENLGNELFDTSELCIAFIKLRKAPEL